MLRVLSLAVTALALAPPHARPSRALGASRAVAAAEDCGCETRFSGAVPNKDLDFLSSIKDLGLYRTDTSAPTTLAAELTRRVNVVAFLRSFGWPLCQEFLVQLERQRPALEAAGVGLLAVGIGTPEKGKLIAEHVGYGSAHLLADPENALYDALALNRGLKETFFSPETPFAMLDRITSGNTRDLLDVVGRWKVVMPPKQSQALLQGGLFVFDGPDARFVHYDASTGAHGDLGAAAALARGL